MGEHRGRRGPVYKERSVQGDESLQAIVGIHGDVSSAIDVATGAGARFRFWMVIGVMAVVFASLMIVVMRGHRDQTEARRKLRTCWFTNTFWFLN